jgi:hypothetical protein
MTGISKVAADACLLDDLTDIASRAAAAILAFSPSDHKQREKLRLLACPRR